MARNSGFTIIEIIICLVMLGLISIFVAHGLVTGVKSYISARENVAITQRTQFAINRMTLEFMYINEILTGTDKDSIVYKSPKGFDPTQSVTVEVNQNQIQIISTFTQGGTQKTVTAALLDNIGTYADDEGFLTYLKSDKSSWTYGTDPLNELYAIDILLIVNRVSDPSDSLRFESSVTLRNNGVANAPEPE